MITEAPHPKPASSTVTGAFLRFFRPDPAAPVLESDPAEVARKYRAWHVRVLVTSIIGYAVYYFVRKNLSVAMPFMEKEMGISKVYLGSFLTLHGLLYGVSKFANGFLGDRANARSVMSSGLAVSAFLNVLFALSATLLVFGNSGSSSLQSALLSLFPKNMAPPPELVLVVVSMGVIWMLNGWFQGMGFPPCARLLTHWFSPKELATKMSIWNTSHSIGAGLIAVLCAYLIKYFHDWRLCFFVPAAIAVVCAIFLWRRLPDTPPSVGLPEVEGTAIGTGEEKASGFSTVLVDYVFSNPYIWIIALANFFVYTIRYAVFDWGPTLLTQAKHFQIASAGWMVFGFEISGLIGALIGGWMTDRFFGGRCMRACVIYMALAGVSILLFWKIAGHSWFLNTTLLCAAGFFIYGPQCLVGIAAANLATKRAAATSVGLTGLFGYASTLASGWGLGTLVKHHGWDAGFAGLLGVAAIGTLLFAAAWRAKAHGYKC